MHKTITLTLKKVSLDQIAELKEQYGMFNDSEVIRQAIADAHRQMNEGKKKK